MKLKGLFILTLVASIVLSSCRKKEEEFSTVELVGLEWTTESAAIKEYRNGEPIKFAATKEEWEANTLEGVGVYSYVNYDASTEDKYGLIYNHFVIADSRGFAPEGWRVPTGIEFENLINSFDPSWESAYSLKSVTGWIEVPNCPHPTNGDNSSGFGGLPSGSISVNGKYRGLGSYCYMWCSDYPYISAASAFTLRDASSTGSVSVYDRRVGFHVRFVKE